MRRDAAEALALGLELGLTETEKCVLSAMTTHRHTRWAQMRSLHPPDADSARLWSPLASSAHQSRARRRRRGRRRTARRDRLLIDSSLRRCERDAGTGLRSGCQPSAADCDTLAEARRSRGSTVKHTAHACGCVREWHRPCGRLTVEGQGAPPLLSAHSRRGGSQAVGGRRRGASRHIRSPVQLVCVDVQALVLRRRIDASVPLLLHRNLAPRRLGAGPL